MISKSERDAALGGCNWIPWDSKMVQGTSFDPTRAFSALVVVIMFARFLQGHDWNVSLLLAGFIFNPYVVIFLLVAIVVAYTGNGKAPVSFSNLPTYDRWTVEWYWWNAWLYHGVMDGASGTLQGVPVVVSQYQILDRRFITHDSVPWTVGLVEILVMQPLCLWTMYAILTKSPLRFPLEIITSTLHIMGMILFVGAEVYDGQLNVPANDPVGIPGDRFGNVNLTSLDQFTYYWFGFWFCNLVWGYVPLLRIQRAVQECARAFQKSNDLMKQS